MQRQRSRPLMIYLQTTKRGCSNAANDAFPTNTHLVRLLPSKHNCQSGGRKHGQSEIVPAYPRAISLNERPHAVGSLDYYYSLHSLGDLYYVTPDCAAADRIRR